jgi:hypothetical protein
MGLPRRSGGEGGLAGSLANLLRQAERQPEYAMMRDPFRESYSLTARPNGCPVCTFEEDMPINAFFGETLGSTWLDHLLTSGRGDMHLYHIILFYFASTIVYPDRIVADISERLRKPLGWRAVILSEFGYLVLMIAMTLHFRAIDPRFSLWEPIFLISFWLVIRLIYSFVCHAFDLE